MSERPLDDETASEAPVVGAALQGPGSVLVASGPAGSRELLTVRKDSIERHPYPLDQEQIPIGGMKTGDGWWILSSGCLEDNGTTCAPVFLTALDESLRQRSQVNVADEGSQVQIAASDTTVVVSEVTDTSATLLSSGNDDGAVIPIWESGPFDMSKIREQANRTQDFSLQPPGFRICASSERVLASYAGPDANSPQMIEIDADGQADASETPGLSEQPSFLSCPASTALAVTARPSSLEVLNLDSGDIEHLEVDLPGDTTGTAADPYSTSMIISSTETSAATTDTSAAMGNPSPPEPLPIVVARVELVDDMTVSVLFEGPSRGIPVVTADDDLIAWINGETIVLEK